MKNLLFIPLILVLTFDSIAQQNFTLQQAIDYAHNNNVSIKIAQLGVADADELIIENRAIGLPRLNLTANYQYFIQLPISLVPAEFFGGQPGEFAELQFGTKNNFTTSLQLSSLILDASYLTALKASREYRNFSAKQVGLAKQQIKNSVTLAYFATLIFDESKNAIQQNVTSLEKLLFETTELYKNGFAEQLDIDRLELSIANLRVQLDNLNRQKQIALNNLKFIMGYPLAESLEVTETLQNLMAAGFVAEVMEGVQLSNRMELQILESSKLLNELNLKVQREQGYYPSLAGFASYSQSLQKNNLFKGENNWLPTAVVGLQLNVPLFDGFAREAKIQRVKLDIEEVDRQREQFVQNATLEVENAKITYLNAVERVNSEKKNLELANKIFNTTQIKYREGLASSFELIQAEQSVNQSQAAYIQGLFDVLMAKTNLDIAVGK